MAGLRFPDLQSRPTEFLDCTSLTSTSFSSWSRPVRPRSTHGWRRGASMGNLAPHTDLPSIRTAPCGHPKTGYCLFWPT